MHRHGRVIVLSVVVWGFAITGLGLVHSITLSLIFLAISGAADAVSGVSRMAMLQLATPDNLQGRMQGVGMAVWITGPYLGDFEAGGVAAVTSVDTSILVGGVACVVCILGLAKALPAFSRFDSHQRADAIGGQSGDLAGPVPDIARNEGASHSAASGKDLSGAGEPVPNPTT